ncbi:MAG: MBL fold metallo-hydrolase [Bacteroidota bacterium]|nr:MBL fold metallo-hydrolase [Bacteroidota bacterium]MDP4231996.1 MBL fold metallo-hydrolase [Bacteroidota bacterium]MDP4241297.1 MBL fold metallo-hydrolase [Bacteroidota bacterium]
MKVTLLGTGTSTGVPMIGCDCRTCRSEDSRDKRLRVSVLIEHDGKNILIDTSADFRQQMLSHGVTHLEAILYTHNHYDHIAGFDDIRAFQFLRRKAPPCYADEVTTNHIRRTFDYAFGAATQLGGGLPEVRFTIIDEQPFDVFGLRVIPVPLIHGRMSILGFRIGGFAYLTDCSEIPEASFALLEGLDTLILDGLRPKPHPTHFSIEEAVLQAGRIAPRITYLTHMNHDVLHEAVERELPPHVKLGFDGLAFEVTS